MLDTCILEKYEKMTGKIIISTYYINLFDYTVIKSSQ